MDWQYKMYKQVDLWNVQRCGKENSNNIEKLYIRQNH